MELNVLRYKKIYVCWKWFVHFVQVRLRSIHYIALRLYKHKNNKTKQNQLIKQNWKNNKNLQFYRNLNFNRNNSYDINYLLKICVLYVTWPKIQSCIKCCEKCEFINHLKMKILDYFNSTFLSKTLTNYVHYKHTSTNQLKECMKVAPE